MRTKLSAAIFVRRDDSCSVRSPRTPATIPGTMDYTMGSRHLRWTVVVGAVILAGALGVQASAQNGATIVFPNRPPELLELLDRGRQMELRQRWGDALTHYEEALRLFPDDRSLQQRFAVARAHYDLGRRYADGSFCRLLGQLSASQALELYAQVLLKIQTHYVDCADWKTLVDSGTANLEMALAAPVFLERNVPEGRRGAVDGFRAELRRAMASLVVSSRYDARHAAATAAQLAQEQLAIAPTAVVFEYLCGAVNALDQYSAYLTPDQLNEVYAQIEGNFVGLGVELKAHNSALRIVRVIPGSPAELAGIRADDLIVAVDGRPIQPLSTEEAANLLRGEEGTLVRISVVTPGQEPRDVVVQRRRVEVPSIDQASIIDPQHGIAYLRLVCFQKATCRDLDAALRRLQRAGMRFLIVDVRNNPGGVLTAAVDAADRFIERGIIVSTRGRSSQEDFTYSAHSEGTWRVPLVVLIDQNSASAAEIFAGAIRDHRRGTVVGVRSFGKGSVQGIFPLEGSTAGLRLTTAKFYSPSGRPYTGSGVEPDILVHTTARFSAERLEPTGTDPILAAGLQVARGQLQLGRR